MTLALQLLRRERVSHVERPYEIDPEAEGYGLDAAEKLNVEAARVFKTLVCQAEGAGLLMVLVPAASRVDFKKLARHLGAKKADMAEPAAAERATGYVVGGISPLGARKRLPVVAD